MTKAEQIHACLQDAFQPTALTVIDDSESHRGHSGHRDEGETHFNVMIRAKAFAGQSRIARHRAIHRALGDIVPQIHALALDVDV